jgi:hypothetical protein
MSSVVRRVLTACAAVVLAAVTLASRYRSSATVARRAIVERCEAGIGPPGSDYS